MEPELSVWWEQTDGRRKADKFDQILVPGAGTSTSIGYAYNVDQVIVLRKLDCIGNYSESERRDNGHFDPLDL
jgi:hypothetical protein